MCFLVVTHLTTMIPTRRTNRGEDECKKTSQFPPLIIPTELAFRASYILRQHVQIGSEDNLYRVRSTDQGSRVLARLTNL
jgi:hypothetical protein